MSEVVAGPLATAASQRRRWHVHLTLLVTLGGSLVSLVWLSHSITIHVIVGTGFMVILVAHFVQRRRTIVALAHELQRRTSHRRRVRRLALSDAVLELLVLDVLASGLVDALHHHSTDVPFLSALGVSPGLVQWHKLAAVALTVYAATHVVRRRRRLRHSSIR